MLKFQRILNQLPTNLSNKITNLATRNVCIDRWNNNLLGLSSFPIKTIIDIGANQGQSTQKLANVFPNATLYAIEPGASSYLKLSTLAKKSQKIISLPYAIGNQETTIDFHHYLGANQASSVLAITPETENEYPVLERVEIQKVQQKTLDSLSLSLMPDLLIKIDVQGYEKQVIEGGEKTFSKAKACIVEITNEKSYQGQCSFKDIFMLLEKYGFSYHGNIAQILGKKGEVKYFDAVFINYQL